MLRNFMTAVQFLTIIPVSKSHRTAEADLSKSMVYFPVVGFMLGIILVYADKALQWVLPDTIENVVLLFISVILTRALHVDGLADTLDGLMGGRDADSRLRIMRDSRIGTAGVVGIVLLMLLKYAGLNNLFNDSKTSVLLTAPVFGRWSQMLMMFKAEYGRENGMGRAFVGHMRLNGLIGASVLAVGLSAFVIFNYDLRTAVLAVGIPCAVGAFTLLWRWWIVKKIGGVAGDTVGAARELSEALTLVLFVFLMSGR